jgi:hypothetical protein
VELRGTEAVDILPSEYNTTSKIHEYGGGACVVSPDGSIIFTDANTNGVFRLSSGSVKSVRQGSPTKRFGDFNVHPLDTNWILAVHEEHRGDEVVNCIVVINDETQNTDFVAEGADFYSHPRFSPDGKRICWTQWNHPDMPWTGTELYVADWNDGNVVKGTLKKIAGELRKESICQPRWNSDGSLVYSSDRNDFWLLYRLDPETSDVEYLKVDGFEDSDFGGRQIFLGEYVVFSLMNLGKIDI